MTATETPGIQRLATSLLLTSGEGGIRTPGTLSCTQHFQCCTINHSATSPFSVPEFYSIFGEKPEASSQEPEESWHTSFRKDV